MREMAVGLALMWSVSTLRGRSFKVTGILSIVLLGFIAWGVGTLVLSFLQHFTC